MNFRQEQYTRGDFLMLISKVRELINRLKGPCSRDNRTSIHGNTLERDNLEILRACEYKVVTQKIWLN